MLTWFKSTGFLLVRPFKIVGVFISSGWCGSSLKLSCGKFSDKTQHTRNFGSSSGGNEMLSWGLYSARRWTYGTFTVRSCEELSIVELKNLETIHFQTHVDIDYFYYLLMKNSFLNLCWLLTYIILMHVNLYLHKTISYMHEVCC
jgi:hypothetical protein